MPNEEKIICEEQDEKDKMYQLLDFLRQKKIEDEKIIDFLMRNKESNADMAALIKELDELNILTARNLLCFFEKNINAAVVNRCFAVLKDMNVSYKKVAKCFFDSCCADSCESIVNILDMLKNYVSQQEIKKNDNTKFMVSFFNKAFLDSSVLEEAMGIVANNQIKFSSSKYVFDLLLSEDKAVSIAQGMHLLINKKTCSVPKVFCESLLASKHNANRLANLIVYLGQKNINCAKLNGFLGLLVSAGDNAEFMADYIEKLYKAKVDSLIIPDLVRVIASTRKYADCLADIFIQLSLKKITLLKNPRFVRLLVQAEEKMQTFADKLISVHDKGVDININIAAAVLKDLLSCEKRSYVTYDVNMIDDVWLLLDCSRKSKIEQAVSKASSQPIYESVQFCFGNNQNKRRKFKDFFV